LKKVAKDTEEAMERIQVEEVKASEVRKELNKK
jgi:hypothetical protein